MFDVKVSRSKGFFPVYDVWGPDSGLTVFVLSCSFSVVSLFSDWNCQEHLKLWISTCFSALMVVPLCGEANNFVGCVCPLGSTHGVFTGVWITDHQERHCWPSILRDGSHDVTCALVPSCSEGIPMKCPKSPTVCVCHWLRVWLVHRSVAAAAASLKEGGDAVAIKLQGFVRSETLCHPLENVLDTSGIPLRSVGWIAQIFMTHEAASLALARPDEAGGQDLPKWGVFWGGAVQSNLQFSWPDGMPQKLSPWFIMVSAGLPVWMKFYMVI